METPRFKNTDLPSILDQLFYHCIEIRITPTKDTLFDAWPGAIIRNNLLFATDNVVVEGNISLREKIDKCPINIGNPFYKELKEGFPKGYLISIPDVYPSEVHLKKGELFCFSLYLIGNMATYFSEFVDSISLMCSRGLGHPKVPFTLIDICEKDLDDKLHLMSTGHEVISDQLAFPISFSDFKAKLPAVKGNHINIKYLTPVILFKQIAKKNNTVSYQDKNNGFPSFYQLIRSTVARMAKLTVLYICPDNSQIEYLSMNALDSWIDYATKARLLSVNMQKITLKNSPKKESDKTVPLVGLIGEQQYEGNFERYISMLKFMEALGVGNETVFGLGRFKVNCDV